MRANPVVLKTLVFPKNQEKDVWHALLSFQGTAPPEIPTTGRRAVPPARPKDPSLRRIHQYTDCLDSVNDYFRRPPPLPETDDSAEVEPLERTNPCGEREYRFPNWPCQDNSKNYEKARKQALFAGPACTKTGAVFTPSSAGSRGPGRQP